jgi:amino acid transporter
MNFAEVASRFKETGGPYLYTLEAYGLIPGFVIGWIILVSRLAAYAALINLLVTYLSYLNPVFLEPLMRTVTIILFTLCITIINYIGVKYTAILSNIFAFAKLFPLIIFIIVGLILINSDLLAVRSNPPGFGDFSSSVLILIFAFSGFDATLVNTGEFKNPNKNIPFALIVSILFVAIIYVLIQVVCIGTLPELAASDKPLSDAAVTFMGFYGGLLITAGAVISISGALNATMLAGSRLPFAFSEARQFPQLFSKLHQKFHTPIYSLIAYSSISILVSITGSFVYAVSISVISKVIVFLVVSSILIRLRKIDSQKSDYFRLRFGYTFAFAGIIISVWLLLSSQFSEFRDVMITIIIGLLIYIIFNLIKNK